MLSKYLPAPKSNKVLRNYWITEEAAAAVEAMAHENKRYRNEIVDALILQEVASLQKRTA